MFNNPFWNQSLDVVAVDDMIFAELDKTVMLAFFGSTTNVKKLELDIFTKTYNVKHNDKIVYYGSSLADAVKYYNEV